MKVLVQGLDGRPSEEDVPGAQAVILPGWEAYAFAVHPTPEAPGTWTVSEATTGLYVTRWHKSRGEAEAQAAAKLNVFGRERVDAAIVEARRNNLTVE